MTHLAILDDWDSDGLPKKVPCGCDMGGDHLQELPPEYWLGERWDLPRKPWWKRLLQALRGKR